MFGNVNTLPTYKNNTRNDSLQESIADQNFDIISMFETNKYWNKPPFKNHPNNRFSMV